MSRVTGMVGMLGAAAGTLVAGLGFRSMIGDTERWYEMVEKLNRETGESATRVSELMGAFSLTDSGVESLSSHTRMWAMHMKGMTEMGEDMMMQMGKKAPDPWKQLRDKTAAGSLLEIADKVAKSSQPLLTAAVYYRRGIAQQLLPALKEGRAGLIKLAEEAKRYGVVVTAENLAVFMQFKDAKRELQTTWKGFSLQIMNEVMPLLSKMIGMFRPKLLDAMKSIRPALDWFKDHMDSILATVKGIAYYMAINKVAMAVGGMGIAGSAATVLGGAGYGAGAGTALGSVVGAIGGPATLALAAFVVSGAIGLIQDENNCRTDLIASFDRLKESTGNLIASLDKSSGSGSATSDLMASLWSDTKTAPARLGKAFIDLGDATVKGTESWVTLWNAFTKGAGPAWAHQYLSIIRNYDLLDESTRRQYEWNQAVYDANEELGRFVNDMGIYSNSMMEMTDATIKAAEREMGKVSGTGLAGLKFGGGMVNEDFLANQDTIKEMLARHRALTQAAPNFDFRGSQFNIHQDYRDQDPDRVVIAMKEGFEELAYNSVQSRLSYALGRF